MRGLSRRGFLQLSSFMALSPGRVTRRPDGSDLERLRSLLGGNDGLIWVFTGDSVTQGAHHTYGCRSYPEIFAERVRWEMKRYGDFIINTAINGDNTSGLLDSFDGRVSRFRPRVVSVMYGINDCQASGMSTREFQRNLKAIVRKVREANAIPVLNTPNDVDHDGIAHMKTASRARLPEFVNIIRQTAGTEGAILVDHWGHWNSSKPQSLIEWLDDPFHPNGRGHAALARLIFKEFSIFNADSFTCGGIGCQ